MAPRTLTARENKRLKGMGLSPEQEEAVRKVWENEVDDYRWYTKFLSLVIPLLVAVLGANLFYDNPALASIDNLAVSFDILVCGHTHREGSEKNSEGVVWYYNSGSWASRKNTYLKIDTDGLIAIYEWKGGKTILLD